VASFKDEALNASANLFLDLAQPNPGEANVVLFPFLFDSGLGFSRTHPILKPKPDAATVVRSPNFEVNQLPNGQPHAPEEALCFRGVYTYGKGPWVSTACVTTPENASMASLQCVISLSFISSMYSSLFPLSMPPSSPKSPGWRPEPSSI